MLSTLAAASLRNADLYDAAVSARTRADATMDLVKTLYDNLGVNSVSTYLHKQVAGRD